MSNEQSLGDEIFNKQLELIESTKLQSDKIRLGDIEQTTEKLKKKYTTIRIQNTTKDRLESLGRKKESFDEIIIKLLDKTY